MLLCSQKMKIRVYSKLHIIAVTHKYFYQHLLYMNYNISVNMIYSFEYHSLVCIKNNVIFILDEYIHMEHKYISRGVAIYQVTIVSSNNYSFACYFLNLFNIPIYFFSLYQYQYMICMKFYFYHYDWWILIQISYNILIVYSNK